jgi:hypothetical protein
MIARLRSALFASALFLLAACDAKVDATSAGGDCPAPSPGTCLPGTECVGGARRTGEAKCVDHQWLCVEAPCVDAGVDAACEGTPVTRCVSGRVSEDCCPPGGFCVTHDYCELGGGACSQGVCPADAGACVGLPITYCGAGTIQTLCCPPGAPCVAPGTFCDLGGGRCSDGACDADAGCAKGSIHASSYDPSCALDADCTSVFDGDLCGLCFCPNAAINARGRAQWQSDFEAHHPAPGTCSCPFLGTPKCAAGTCVFAR